MISNPGQTEKTWKIEIQDDSKFERSETFELKLTEPVMGALEYPDIAIVTITDIEDGKFISVQLSCLMYHRYRGWQVYLCTIVMFNVSQI